MNFKFDIFIEAFPDIIPFIWTTLILVLIAFTLALILSVILAIIVEYKVPVLFQIIKVYISFFRSTPMISQLFFFYFGVTPIIPFLKSAPQRFQLFSYWE